MKKFLSKYKYVIIFNLLIVASYTFISSTVSLFGIDDTLANSYGKGLSFIESFNHVLMRASNWNARIGEILYFIVGCFPRWVYFLLNGIVVLLFFNLVYIFTFGIKAKEYFNTKKYFITLFFNYVMCLTLFPAFSEVFIWMAGAFNHLWDTTIVLIAALPFRLLYDKYDVFKGHKLRLIPHFIFCVLSGFSVENVVPWLIVYMFLIIVVSFKRNINTIWSYISIGVTSVCYIIMCFLHSTNVRIDFFYEKGWTFESKIRMPIYVMESYKYILIILLILSVVYFILRKLKKNDKEVGKLSVILLQFLVSFVSLIVICFAPYFALRVTTLLFFFMMTLSTYLLSAILNNKILNNILIVIYIALIIFISFRYRAFYKDFNEFNELRLAFISEQYYSGDDILLCPSYDNKYNYFFPHHLVSYETLFCDTTYINYLFEDEVHVFGTEDITLR